MSCTMGILRAEAKVPRCYLVQQSAWLGKLYPAIDITSSCAHEETRCSHRLQCLQEVM